MKLHIDMCYGPGGAKSIMGYQEGQTEQLLAVTDGCLGVLQRLGVFAEMIEGIRVTFDVRPPMQGTIFSWGPRFVVHYVDPIGRKGSYGIDYEGIGKGGTSPSAKEIVEHFCAENCLPRFLRDHVRDGQQVLTAVNQKYRRLVRSS